MRQRHALLSISAGLLFVAIIALLLMIFTDTDQRISTAVERRASISMAILGDSDSHSYHDSTSFASVSAQRGGPFHAITLNWPEALARLRADQIDLGEWAVWGPPRPIALAREMLGLTVRRPRKQDYRHNFAISGAHCGDLLSGWRQVDRLLVVMDAEPERWQHGIVVVRIGVNSFGGKESLQKMADDPASQAPLDSISRCLDAIRDSVAMIRSRHPQTRFVLVGIFDNTNWVKNLDKWQSPDELSNITSVLDIFDDALQGMAAADERIAFFDDRAWFRQHWGSRDESGMPAYHDVVLGNGSHVHNSSGDNPSNAVLGDGHAGTVWNGLWAQSLIALVNRKFGLDIRPIHEDEILRLLGTTNAANPQN